MKLDAELMFECLIYLNWYYYPILALMSTIMTVAKFYNGVPTVFQEGSVAVAAVGAELAKLVLYTKYKNRRRDLITGVSVVLTFVTIASVLYIFFIQIKVSNGEYIIGAMTILLTITEVIFGTLQILPCIHKVQYY